MTDDILQAADLASDEALLQEVKARLRNEHFAQSAREAGEVAASGRISNLTDALKEKSKALCTDIYGDVTGRLAKFIDDARGLVIDALTFEAIKPGASAAPVAALAQVSDGRLAASLFGRLRPTNPDGTPRERPMLKAIQEILTNFVKEFGPQLASTFGPQLLQLLTGLFAAASSLSVEPKAAKTAPKADDEPKTDEPAKTGDDEKKSGRGGK